MSNSRFTFALQNPYTLNATQFIQKQVNAPVKSIENTLQLLAEDCTIPFIARYRKERTGNLDETVIELIAKLNKEFAEIEKRKESILKSIEEQNALTPELKSKIDNCFDLQELEDLYLPYKKKKSTKASVARELGLEPLAKIIMSQKDSDIDYLAGKYVNDKVENEEAALQGARDIIAEWINENLFVRRQLRRTFQHESIVASKVVKKLEKDEKAQKYRQYFDWNEPLKRCPSHRLLAMLRAESEGIIKLSVNIDNEEALAMMEKNIIKAKNETTPHIKAAIKDSYKRLLEPAISNEALQEAKSKADDDAIAVFAENLQQLLLAAPLGEKRILAIDPGFRTGCKVVCLDEKGDLLTNGTIFPHEPQNQWQQAATSVLNWVDKYGIEAIAIGNGTASRETEQLVRSVKFNHPVEIFVVNESGASVYSASAVAREEFPDYDVTVRGAISIGRRLSDPLAELVKIDPKSIGVGQYQHDVNQSKLKQELDTVVVRCVNRVGVNLNTASKSLLSYVSGIGEKMAENIVNYRSENGAFANRNALKKVPRLGEKAFQQAAAFLRIVNGSNPLDNSAVHPESYTIVQQMAKDKNVSVAQLIGNQSLIQSIDLSKYITADVGLPTLQDIVKELEKPGLDPRQQAKAFAFDPNIKSIKDLRTGMVLPGIVNNITNFGCFVDIGIKESGLVHISQLKEGFVSNVNDVVKLHQQVQVKVVEVDEARKRVALSMVL